MSSTVKIRGKLMYDDYSASMVCTCTETVYRDDDDDPIHADYEDTVTADKNSGTESGSYWYTCQKCGAAGWSGL